jgi:AbrB family looped-hinge helix DNA binding protein
MFTTTVTQKGQVTLPKKVRQMLNIEAYDQVRVTVSENKAVIEPVADIIDMAGTVKPRKGGSALKARELMEKEYTSI